MSDSLELKLESRQGGGDVKRIALAAATTAATFAATAGATGPALVPHIYQTRITGSPVAPLNATWQLTLLNHSFNLARNRAGAVTGSLVITGHRITFHDVAGQFACRGTQITGVYGWHLTGSQLTFTRYSDRCAGRRTVLAHAFTRIA
jgi:hypothetical protein